jgi:predicted esterase
MEHHTFKTPRTAHYYTLGTPSPETRYWIIACHGYGQLAGNFIRKFDVLARPDVFVLAPEGLSRFYWNGMDGEVAASWMTKADRLDEIEDYCNFLSALYDQYRELLPPDVRIVLLGFSQGCATQARWAMKRFPDFHDLVLWAGAMPEDIDYKAFSPYWMNKRIFTVLGSQDPFITPKVLDQQLTLFEAHGLKTTSMEFEGGHTVDRQALLQWAEDYLF